MRRCSNLGYFPLDVCSFAPILNNFFIFRLFYRIILLIFVLVIALVYSKLVHFQIFYFLEKGTHFGFFLHPHVTHRGAKVNFSKRITEGTHISNSRFIVDFGQNRNIFQFTQNQVEWIECVFCNDGFVCSS